MEVLHPLLGEGQRFLIACAGDPEAAVLQLQFDGDFAKQLLVRRGARRRGQSCKRTPAPPSSSRTVDGNGRTPVPGEELGELGHLVIGDAGQHVGEPSLRIDVIEFTGAD